MIYMQRPDATACAEYDFWNDKMGRYIRRGSKGNKPLWAAYAGRMAGRKASCPALYA